MSKEQILEIKKDLDAIYSTDFKGDYESGVMDVAVKLYNAGYRKQREGFWGYDEGCDCFVCSICGYLALNNYRGLSVNSKFCPHCGARMKGGN